MEPPPAGKGCRRAPCREPRAQAGRAVGKQPRHALPAARRLRPDEPVEDARAGFRGVRRCQPVRRRPAACPACAAARYARRAQRGAKPGFPQTPGTPGRRGQLEGRLRLLRLADPARTRIRRPRRRAILPPAHRSGMEPRGRTAGRDRARRRRRAPAESRAFTRGARSGRRRPARATTPARNCARRPSTGRRICRRCRADSTTASRAPRRWAASRRTRWASYDLGGNAWEWCEDRFAPGGEARVLRGGSWGNVRADLLLSSQAHRRFPGHAQRSVRLPRRAGNPRLRPRGNHQRTAGRDGLAGRPQRGPDAADPRTRRRRPGGVHGRLDGYQPATVSGQVAADTRWRCVRRWSPWQGPRAGQPWENGLGMRFVPVGPALLFSVWTTRVADYERFAAKTGARRLPAVDFAQGPQHPAVNVSRDDAEAFCAWLTARELAAGRLQANQVYRLPTDHEWSHAAGLPDEHGRHARGARWPGARVLSLGQGLAAAGERGQFCRVRDGGRQPARARRVRRRSTSLTRKPRRWAVSRPTRSGLYDMAGNVWQWCADNYKKSGALRHWGVLRGGSWADYGPSILQSSYRNVVRERRTGRDLRFPLRHRPSSQEMKNSLSQRPPRKSMKAGTAEARHLFLPCIPSRPSRPSREAIPLLCPC